MKSHRCLPFLVAITCVALPAWTASANIGIASAISTYSVNGAAVSGSSDISDGTALRTTAAPSNVQLENGATLLLATRSAGIVFNDHLSLNEGAVRISNFAEYPVATRSLEIRADSPNTEAVVRTDGKTVLVASIGGTVRVTDGGAMMTRVAAGTRMAFDDQAQSPANQTGNTTQTGASAPRKRGGLSDADTNALLWSIGVIAGTAAVLGIIAGVKGRNPF